MHRYLDWWARGKRCPKKEIGIDIEDEEQAEQTANIYGKLQIEGRRTPVNRW
jgi:hypothetical protein